MYLCSSDNHDEFLQTIFHEISWNGVVAHIKILKKLKVALEKWFKKWEEVILKKYNVAQN